MLWCTIFLQSKFYENFRYNEWNHKLQDLTKFLLENQVTKDLNVDLIVIIVGMEIVLLAAGSIFWVFSPALFVATMWYSCIVLEQVYVWLTKLNLHDTSQDMILTISP